MTLFPPLFRAHFLARALATALVGLVLGCTAARGEEIGKSEPAALDPLTLIGQLRGGEIESLEKRLHALQGAYEAGLKPEEEVDSAFGAFANSERGIEEKLNEWVRRYPHSYAALMARGRHFTALGWHARQGAYARFTDPKQFQVMSAYFARARADLAAAIDLNPRLTVAYAALMSIAMATGADDTLRTLMARGLAAEPMSEAIYSAYFHSLRPEWQGSFSAMRRFMDLVESKRPTNPKIPRLKVPYVLARVHHLRQERRYAEAIALLSATINEEGKYSSLYRERGACHGALGRFEPALEDLTRSLKIFPHSPEALGERALVLASMKRHAEALADISFALRHDPRDSGLLRLRADINRALGKPRAALRDLHAAMEFGAFDERVWQTQAWIYAEDLDSPSKAMEIMESMMSIRTDHGPSWGDYHSFAFDLGMKLYRQKRDCEGAAVFMRFLSSCRDSAVCKSRLWYTAAPIMGSAVAETRCPAKPAP
jgi:tetratricopeptide (TPR) repeat protein